MALRVADSSRETIVDFALTLRAAWSSAARRKSWERIELGELTFDSQRPAEISLRVPTRRLVVRHHHPDLSMPDAVSPALLPFPGIRGGWDCDHGPARHSKTGDLAWANAAWLSRTEPAFRKLMKSAVFAGRRPALAT